MIPDKVDAQLVTIADCRYGRMMYLSQDKYIGQALRLYGEYSESEVELWRQLLKTDAICVDAGANIGSHTVALARLVPNGAVIALEPLRFMFHLLCGNVALNGLTNVVTYYAAAGAQRGSIVVPGIDYTKEENYGGLALGAWDKGNHVPVLPLDELIPKVDFIKADVEGMEQQVLQGARRLIDRWRPVLYLENNFDPDYGFGVTSPRQRALIDYAHSLSYDCWWHYAPHFNPENYKAASQDIYQGVVSVNMLCLPAHPDNHIDGLERISRLT